MSRYEGRASKLARWQGFVLLMSCGLLLAAGCGQPPPSSDQGAGGGQEETTEETTAETTAETTEETTEETTAAVEVGGTPELAEAADEYEEYVVEQVGLLEERTKGFTDAVLAGDVEKAKKRFGPAREPWERIEPIAASLGDYDPNIDAREGDVPDEDWRGFHRIEKSLWVENTTEGQEGYARLLLENVRSLE